MAAGLFDLLAPFFGLIALGFIAGKVARRPEGAAGLAWMQVFVIYVALPCLFFRLLADKPVERFLNWRFVAATSLATLVAFALAFAVGRRAAGGSIPDATVAAVAGSYANIG